MIMIALLIELLIWEKKLLSFFVYFDICYLYSVQTCIHSHVQMLWDQHVQQPIYHPNLSFFLLRQNIFDNCWINKFVYMISCLTEVLPSFLRDISKELLMFHLCTLLIQNATWFVHFFHQNFSWQTVEAMKIWCDTKLCVVCCGTYLHHNSFCVANLTHYLLACLVVSCCWLKMSVRRMLSAI